MLRESELLIRHNTISKILYLGKFLKWCAVTEVEEPVLGAKSVLFELEVDEVAEPKALLPKDLLALVSKCKSIAAISRLIGVSESFVRQNLNKS